MILIQNKNVSCKFQTRYFGNHCKCLDNNQRYMTSLIFCKIKYSYYIDNIINIYIIVAYYSLIEKLKIHPTIYNWGLSPKYVHEIDTTPLGMRALMMATLSC